MKEKLLILGAMVALCCSCAGNSVLLDTESELNGLNNEYELGTLEVSDNGLKCETLGDEDSIQVLKDNYIAEIMGRMEVAKEKSRKTSILLDCFVDDYCGRLCCFDLFEEKSVCMENVFLQSTVCCIGGG